ncbi:glycosyltransferase family 4 protein [Neobacillus cucumis]|uniref:glycosyltransferase family 4 protein n=1 Tax=Neobacillus cucumis TaxID=1740721 RepID=UPI0018DF8F2C|nr:glycosyltransferase family 4 protein [Neobacillus cucumis]MBI0577956.1 glycosyltransferase family 4 protein [Neobacillus cucumis]
MKILVLVPSLQEKGPVIVAESIAKFSNDTNLKYIFVSLRNNTMEDQYRFLNHRIEIHQLGMGKFPLPKDIRKIKEIVNKISPDVIHVHSFWPTILASQYLLDYNTLVTLHSNTIEDLKFDYGNAIGRIMAFVFFKALKKFNRIVAVSQYVKDCHVGYNSDLKSISIINNGIEDRFISFNFNNNDGRLNLLSISVLNKVKNIYKSLEIIKLLRDRNIKVYYRIIGDGPERENIEAFVRVNGLEDMVKIEGKVNRSDVFNFINESDALIFTSLSEGFGLVVVESMMMGKPAIVSNISVMTEIIDNQIDGIIATNNNDFINGIYKLINKEEYKMLSFNSREKYLKKFTAKKMTEAYEREYFKMIH